MHHRIFLVQYPIRRNRRNSTNLKRNKAERGTGRTYIKMFQSFQLSPSILLRNRMVMAPMTRSRSPKGIVQPITVTYYEQRASAGLIITEGTVIHPDAVGYIDTPGIYSKEQVEAWKPVIKAVHDKGGKIFCQLWHCGRVSHKSFHNGKLPVAPSAVGFPGKAFTYEGFKDIEMPRALELKEIPQVVDQFRQASKNAKLAGFDGVEIHGANGYLVDQFLRTSSNKRTDEYGGSAVNRVRFAIEVAKAVCEAWEPKRVGFRLGTQTSKYFGMEDANPEETFTTLAKGLNSLPLAYIHLIEPVNAPVPLSQSIRKISVHPMIANQGFTKDSAEKSIQSGNADMISFGSLFLANPDLPTRFQKDAKLNTPDPKTFYGGDEKGYTDYSFL